MSVRNDAEARALIEAYVSGLIVDGTIPARLPENADSVVDDLALVLAHAGINVKEREERVAFVRKGWQTYYRGRWHAAMLFEALTKAQRNKLFAQLGRHGAVPADDISGGLKRARDVADAEALVNKSARIEGEDKKDLLTGEVPSEMRTLIRCFLSPDERVDLMLTSTMLLNEENTDTFWKSACTDVRNRLLDTRADFPQEPDGAVLTLLNTENRQDFTRRAYRAVLSQVAESMTRAVFEEMYRFENHDYFNADSGGGHIVACLTAKNNAICVQSALYDPVDEEEINHFIIEYIGWASPKVIDPYLLRLMKKVNTASATFERMHLNARRETLWLDRHCDSLDITMCYSDKVRFSRVNELKGTTGKVIEAYKASCALREAFIACFFYVLMHHDLLAFMTTTCSYNEDPDKFSCTVSLLTGGGSRKVPNPNSNDNSNDDSDNSNDDNDNDNEASS